ncbi:MAG: 5-(carboxyamino)imidazole ribonucleotide synthase [Bacteroidota bacterium]
MADNDFQTKSIGILGGGQLGRMLIQEAVNLNIPIAVLDPDPDAPCKNIADRFEVGSFQDYETVINFGRSVDVLTVEIEHVNVDALEALEKEGKKVRPSSAILRVVQDKGAQKEFYKSHGIPTSEFILVNDRTEIATNSHFLPSMQKLRKGGYDGKGVTALRSKNELEKAFDAPSVLEKMIDIDKEFAVIVSRNPSGQMATYPAVEMEFNRDANLVDLLFAPSGLTESQCATATTIAKRLAESLELEGVLAVEFFLTTDGEILVNEIAPRPHNSGHSTIEGNVTSQFEQHLRSILDLPPGNTDLLSASVMINVLGESGHVGIANYRGLSSCLSMSGVHIHLYGKKFTKPFRKMGHVTICSNDLEQALSTAKQVQKTLKVISE